MSLGSPRSLAPLSVIALSVAALSLPLVAPAAAQTSDYFPLGESWSWTYGSGGALPETNVWVSGTEELLGRETVVVSTEVDGSAIGISESFYSRDETGNVYLHGHRTVGLGVFVAYEPPVLFIDAPLALGKSWTSTVTEVDLSDELPRTRRRLAYECEIVDAATFTVPAGEFFGYELAATETSGNVTEPLQVVDGVGMIRLTSGPVTHELEEYAGATPIEALSWGALKDSHR